MREKYIKTRQNYEKRKNESGESSATGIKTRGSYEKKDAGQSSRQAESTSNKTSQSKSSDTSTSAFSKQASVDKDTFKSNSSSGLSDAKNTAATTTQQASSGKHVAVQVAEKVAKKSVKNTSHYFNSAADSKAAPTRKVNDSRGNDVDSDQNKQSKAVLDEIYKSIKSIFKVTFSSLISIQMLSIMTIGVSVVLVIFALGYYVLSPLGIFSNGGGGKTVASVMTEIDQEFNDRITNIIRAVSPDELHITYEGSPDNSRTNNWIDVLGVFAVKTALSSKDSVDVVIMDDNKIEKLRKVFFDMNIITHRVEIISHPAPAGSKLPPTHTTILYINVKTILYVEAAILNKFNPDQRTLLNEIEATSYRPMWSYIIPDIPQIEGTGTFDGVTVGDIKDMTPDEANDYIKSLNNTSIGNRIVLFAYTQLGYPYSKRDCSTFTRYVYQQCGVHLEGYAAAQAQYCDSHGFAVSLADLQPGDLIFYSFIEDGQTNNRYKNIDHVGIYAGDGMMIDSSKSNGRVVFRPVRGLQYQVGYGRPR